MTDTKLWAAHSARWRDPAEVLSFPPGLHRPDPRLLQARVRGAWWETLGALGITLLVTREYEHLLMALAAPRGRPHTSYLPLPHPSGVALADDGGVFVASTRNPNQIFELRPAAGLLDRVETRGHRIEGRPLVPVRSWLVPGCLYLHDLAFIGGVLHGNAVASNAVVRFREDGRHERVWWPRCVERAGVPVVDRNLIQLNSIAAGPTLDASFFTASTDRPSRRRPTHRDFAVDRRGVLLAGASRDVVARGLTRPHSARLHRGAVWIDDSGYGRVVRVARGQVEEVVRLRGWTRGLAFTRGVAFVGTSRVIPRFRQFAPGLSVADSECGVHAVDVASGRVLGSLIWPHGNQIFAIACLPSRLTSGLPYAPRPRPRRERALFFAYRTVEEKA
jgi:uncharacterized protein (TIGR03032 family)